jgi:outer membrane protein OmpA-like peptidoglycan-associated protein
MRNRSLAVALATLASVAVGACGGSSKSAHSSHHATRSTTKTVARTANHPLVALKAIQQGAHLQPYRLTIYDLRREGPYVVLDFGIACQVPGGGCDSRFDFSLPTGTPEGSAGINEPSAVTLVDPVTDKQYGVVYDSHANPQASELPFQSFDDDSLHLAWVKFPAPPVTTRTLDVVFPSDGPQIPNVPLSDAPAPLPTSLGPGGTRARPGGGAQPADSTSTAGMTLPVTNLSTTAGNAAGSDTESSNKATITLRTDVLFRFAKSNLTPRARAILGPLAAKIKSRAAGPVQVTGYTDSIGTDQVNVPLSHARAATVVAALEPLLPEVTFHAAGLGSSDPVAPNTKPDGSDNPAGRALNRRVTISFPIDAPTPAAPPVSAPGGPTSQAATARIVDYTATSPGETNRYQVTVNGLYREGNLAVLKLGITCTLPVSQSCNAATDFIGSQSVPPITFAKNFLASSFSTFWSLGGFYLTDPTTGTEYIPVYQASGEPLTAPLSNNMVPAETYPVWIYLSAPPPSTTAVTVSLPGGSPKIGNVPITPAPTLPGG